MHLHDCRREIKLVFYSYNIWIVFGRVRLLVFPLELTASQVRGVVAEESSEMSLYQGS